MSKAPKTVETTTTTETSFMPSKKEPTWKGAWRPAAAFIYLFVCLMDFVVLPMTMVKNSNPAITVDLAMKFKQPAARIQALQTLQSQKQWTPLTTQGNGVFHLAFGAILGAAAFGRSQEKTAKIRKGSAAL